MAFPSSNLNMAASFEQKNVSIPKPVFPTRRGKAVQPKKCGTMPQGTLVTLDTAPNEMEKRTACVASLTKTESVLPIKRQRRFSSEKQDLPQTASTGASLFSKLTEEIVSSQQIDTNTSSSLMEDFFSCMKPSCPEANFRVMTQREPQQDPARVNTQFRLKRAQIINIPNEDMSEEVKNLVFNGEFYPIELIGVGNFHNVYRFCSDKKLMINDIEIPVSDVVIKTLKSILGPKSEEVQYKNDLKAALDAESAGVPLARILIRPDQVLDPMDPKNGFWIIERMATSVAEEDDDAFEFAKYWLLRSVQEGKELINDLYARNLMRNKEGKIRVVDCGVSEVNEHNSWNCDFIPNLVGYLFHWSLGGDPHKLSLLMESYPVDLQNKLLKGIEEKKITQAISSTK